MVKEEKDFKDYFDDVIQFIKDTFPESLLSIVIIICIAYIISSLIQMFKINLNLSF